MKKATNKEVKKPVVKKKSASEVRDVNHVELVTYSMKMVIPTGAYANIQPEITVKAFSPEIAEAYIAPHMNKLWKEYYMISERPAPVKTAPKADNTAKTAPQRTEAPVISNPIPQAPVSTVAFQKATQAIASCISKEALDLIATQVEKSVKLSDEDKVVLRDFIIGKARDLPVK